MSDEEYYHVIKAWTSRKTWREKKTSAFANAKRFGDQGILNYCLRDANRGHQLKEGKWQNWGEE